MRELARISTEFCSLLLSLPLSCVEKISSIQSRVCVEIRARPKDPPSTSFTPRTPAVIELLVDEVDARDGTTRNRQPLESSARFKGIISARSMYLLRRSSIKCIR